ncbi:hypothetical protein B0T16DRAFT_454671 [Cercophora newfieldiana]|uniref:Heterokaryon incompatibility domain-containing protein n=1 Tax=Cercophora newfieldiana TaxID=92897 RepID=A0AA39YGN4_9PEZI|nr:hypothetical protein B0T16DRAFT_454671 [Cercophora newfieldiana]
MQNDIVPHSSPRKHINLEQVKGLWKFRVHRQEAERWALHDLRFLVYDDTDDTDAKGDGVDSDVGNPTLQCEIQGRLGVETPLYQRLWRTISSKLSTWLWNCPLHMDSQGVHLDDKSEPEPCSTCSGLPEFPHGQRARRFRVFKPPPIDCLIHLGITCIHYVAVSYCWPEPTFDEHGNIVKAGGTYQVRELDGSLRSNRALDVVLDRAVDFANSCGLRMIWIDQECLPQPTDESSQEDKDYQQLGIQAMDIVYNRAMATSGLHTGEIASQEQLDDIEELIALDESKGQKMGDCVYTRHFFNNVLNFLDMVRQDRWYTRAWVVQEALSAGKNLCLVFWRGPAVSARDRVRFIVSSRNPRPSHSLDTHQRSLPSDLVSIHVDDFRALARKVKPLIKSYFRSGGPALAFSKSDALAIINTAAALHPTVDKPKDNIHMHGGNKRDCRDCQDRIVILANMCGYDIRLNPDNVLRECKSLRIGLMSLMLLNGDLSAIVPEVYGLDSLVAHQGSALVSPFDSHVGNTSHCIIRQGNLMIPQAYSHINSHASHDGIPLPAYMWTVEEELDLSVVKRELGQAWIELKALYVNLTDLPEGETLASRIKRQALVTLHLSRPHIAQQAKSELLYHGAIAGNSSI